MPEPKCKPSIGHLEIVDLIDASINELAVGNIKIALANLIAIKINHLQEPCNESTSSYPFID